MGKKSLIAFFISLILASLFFLDTVNMAVLNPKGWIALREKELLVTATLWMLVIVVPVFALLGFICVRYRAENKKATYNPDWDDNWIAESIWWGFPCVIIFILSVITWNSSHELDPFEPLKSTVKPIHIQVVSLQWKWLFIYPEEKIATINFIQFPKNTPVHFEITAESPMNSFWIPSLGGQIYSMPAMSTQLSLIANEEGSFRGSSANLSGEGFSHMNFIAKASSKEEYEAFLKEVKEKGVPLDAETYESLVAPSQFANPVFYALKKEGLYNDILMKYMPMDTEGDKK